MTKRRIARLALVVFALAVLSAPLGACGKRGNPEPPRDKPATYPKTYPTR